jgi:medium-chain acyl-[acyl-carrier-protein] hydrolase
MKNIELDRWLPTYNNNPNADIRLFCLPYAGSSSLIYNSWSDQLPDFIEVCPIELPGRGRRLAEPPISKIGILVDKIADVLGKWNDKPFAFFGHSMGGLLSYELSKKLIRDFNQNPIHLFVSAHRAPHLTKAEDDVMYNLPEPEFLAKLRDLNGMPKEVLEHQELMEMLLPILRADFTLCETYFLDKIQPLDCPISVFGGLTDDGVTKETLEPWKNHTTTFFKLHMLEGDHFFIFHSFKIILKKVAEELSKAIVNTYNYY